MVGSVESNGIRINDKLTIPYELIKGNLKDTTIIGDKVRIIRNHGGKEFYIVEIMNKPFITKGSIITLTLDGNSKEYKVEDVKI